MEKSYILEDSENWSSNELAILFTDAIFQEPEFTKFVETELNKAQVKVQSLWNLLGILRHVIRDHIGWTQPDIQPKFVERLSKLAAFEKQVVHSYEAYQPDRKINPDAVYWPNPLRSPARSVYDTLPIVKNLGIITKDTPVGSAGSCFAFEIAYNLQKRGFKYVVTEKWHDPENGVSGDVADLKDPDNKYARFSANWGILFNTPSFKQLAEKAFGVKKLPKLIVKRNLESGQTSYADPFRENVFFHSVEAFEANYEKHIAATRKALLESKVFVITLGLNEMWQYSLDGSVISRNPSSKTLMPLLKHRVLSVEENISNIQSFIDITRAHNPDLKLLISVSPIPFLATAIANDSHVITANGHSKAVLRVAAEELCRRNRDVFYFPSYEMVTTCIKNAWETDERHVTRAAVDRVMQLFDAMFVRT
ncbi:MAG: GSCFA domain-containing protein [Deltaproteobacteria bacterium]|nr:GSCFA domain-containing protein [Deltaproteobacteria bacterium]